MSNGRRVEVLLTQGPLQDHEKIPYGGFLRILNLVDKIMPDQDVHRAEVRIGTEPPKSIRGYDQVDTVIKTMQEIDRSGRGYSAFHINVEDSFWKPDTVITEDGVPHTADRVCMLYDIFGRAHDVPVTWDETTTAMLQDRQPINA